MINESIALGAGIIIGQCLNWFLYDFRKYRETHEPPEEAYDEDRFEYVHHYDPWGDWCVELRDYWGGEVKYYYPSDPKRPYFPDEPPF
jgi:hypothetical protein